MTLTNLLVQLWTSYNAKKAIFSSGTPLLFQPITFRGLTLKNRIVVSPMCQYSSKDGFANFWHVQHIGSRVVGGAALFIVEACAVSEIGRITPHCLGLWKDEHIGMLKQIVDFAHEQGGKIGIQLAHSGRKGSTRALWEAFGRTALSNEEGGWEVVGPSPIAFDEQHRMPRELSEHDIEQVIEEFVQAAKRAVAAGFDVIEIHGAHGYLINSFLSPTSNKRTDQYGGSFENRIRLLCDIVTRVRQVIPQEMPLFVRISCEEYTSEGWNIEDTLKLAPILKDLGVDLMDCSSGGNASKLMSLAIMVFPGYQVQYAEKVRQVMPVGAVGKITEPKFANKILEDGKADLIFIGRQELNDPYWPIRAAKELGYSDMPIPPQYKFAGF
ncbi:hypothetical protein C9374_010026 [Naegleria lovaniensis]|uniref:NADH:flavin oxidoreductase/NADH oxidase N-terminal domain-containing protein n=1 Tax=Naegleria lovaniensis TaxID=51637 RepID=A0AA88KJL6_NAELO|nr:uncharacterized protein C9374_010026 [Naegleria lovaniensis]KAG2375022.1 hypothetical protein C9374_010026 [Naegleria lovaniensis]